jgi:hypothetical protein
MNINLSHLIIICIICYTILYFYKTNINIINIDELDINNKYYLAQDKYLIELISQAIFIKYKAPTFYKEMILNIEDFLVTYITLKQNKTNIYLKDNQMIKSDILTKPQQQILINDIRDQLERVLKQIESIIYVLPNEGIYLDNYYIFHQNIKKHLSKYYYEIIDMYNINDHTSEYQLLRTSENQYDYIDWIK